MKKIHWILWFLFIGVLAYSPASAISSVTDLNGWETPTSLANTLVGSGVTISGINYVWNNAQAWTFSGLPSNVWSFTSGVIFSSGNAAASVWPNAGNANTQFLWSWDSDFNTLTAPSLSQDTAFLEFSFTPQYDTIVIDYVFGSDEYNEYVWYGYTDSVGIFVNGVNCAVLPGTTTPVQIDVINNNLNSDYYVDNSSGLYNVEMDGFTKELSCVAPVNAGIPNTLKIWVTDSFDYQLDSWAVFWANGINSYPRDFWDAPDTSAGTWVGNYNTLLTDNGANHVVRRLHLGACSDGDDGTLQNSSANADDTNTWTTGLWTCAWWDDEDWVSGSLLFNQSTSTNLSVTVWWSTGITWNNGFLNAWIDWNQDGDFLDTNEQVVTDIATSIGANNISIATPAWASNWPTYARFRLSTLGWWLVKSFGLYGDGEVEDYQVFVWTSSITHDTLVNAWLSNISAYPVSGVCSNPWNTISISATDSSTTPAVNTSCGAWWTFTWSLDLSSLNEWAIDISSTIDNGFTSTVTDTDSIVKDTIVPVFSAVNISSNNSNPLYAKAGDNITFNLELATGDSWATGNNLDFEIGTWATITTGSFTSTTGSVVSRNRNYSVQLTDSGSISVSDINFYDQLWNSLSGATFPYVPNPNIIVDNTFPIIVLNDDILTGPVQSDTLNIDVTDEYLNPTSLEYGFSADANCDISDSFGNSFSWSTNIEFSDESNNGQYICVKGTDFAGNTSYQISANPLNIDITNPLTPWVISPVDNFVTNIVTPTYTGTGEINSIVSLNISWQTYTWSVDGSGNWSINVSTPLIDDTYSVDIFQTDTAGNVSPTLNTNIIIDTTAPILSEITPVILLGNDATPDYTFSSNETWDITYWWSCSSLTGTGSNGNNTITLSSLPDETYTDCTIIITDEAGNSSNPLSISDFIIDTTIPVITLIWSGSVVVELGDTYADAWATWFDSVDWDITNQIVTSDPVDTNTTASYVVTYNLVDAAWNVAGQVSRSVSVVDSTAPIFTIHDDIDAGPTQSDTINISVNDLDLEINSLEYGFSSDSTCNASDTYWNTFSSWVDIEVNTENNNGSYLCFKASDSTWNITYQALTGTLNIDITPPVIPNTPNLWNSSDSWVSDNDDITNNNTPNFTGSCVNWDTVNLLINNTTNTSTTCSGGTFSLAPTNDLTDGWVDINIVFTDQAGNQSPISPTLSITIDTMSPNWVDNISISDSSDSGDNISDDITNIHTPTVSGTGEANSLISLMVNNMSYTWTTDNNGDWEIDITNSLPDGNYVLTVSEEDIAWNISPDNTLNIVIDTQTPTPTISTPIEWDNTINQYEDEDVLIAGTAEANSEVSITITDQSNNSVTVTATSDNSGNWSLLSNAWDITSLEEWNLTVSVVSSDIAGNQSPASSIGINYDATTPTTIWEIETTIGSNSATISWETGEASSSEIIYGLTNTTDETSGEQDISPKVLSHSVELTDLLSCTTYFYKTQYKDDSWNIWTEWIFEFQTSGCVGSADIESYTTSPVVNNSVGWSISLSQSGLELVSLDIPSSYNTSHPTCPSWAYFQLNKINKIPVIDLLDIPEVKTIWVSTYELSAYCDPDTRVTEFDGEITITMSYNDDEVDEILEDTLLIYRYNTLSSQWNELKDCDINTDINSITCTSDKFSTFWIFGKKKWSSWNYSSSENPIALSEYVSSPSPTPREIALENSTSTENIDTAENKEDDEAEGEINNQVLDTSAESMEKTIVIEGKEISYSVKEDFSSCPIISNIQNPDYTYPTSWVFIDEGTAQNTWDILKFQSVWVIDGFDDNTFRPTQEITRSEFLKFALISHCYNYKQEDPSDLPYTDVDLSSWQAKVIKKSQSLGMINGDIDETWNSIFRPNDIISKSEAVKILMRLSFIQANNPVELSYSDISVQWHIPYVQTGETLWLFDEVESNFMFYPNEWVSRENMIELIKNLILLYK